MIVFTAFKLLDKGKVDKFISDFNNLSPRYCNFIFEAEHSNDWQASVKDKILKSDFIVFLITNGTHLSNPIKWEYETAFQLNKQIYFVLLDNDIEILPDFTQNKTLINTTQKLIDMIENTNSEQRELLIEQYKMMVSSTEKVTEQRLKVNNLFFTVTTSILSVSFLLGKELHFSILGMIGMLALSTMGFIVTYFWDKLVNSYGQLNTGKFELISEIERGLKTDMFQREWVILTDKIKYEPNTKTESKIIIRFRFFIGLVIVTEIIYLLYLVKPLICNC